MTPWSKPKQKQGFGGLPRCSLFHNSTCFRSHRRSRIPKQQHETKRMRNPEPFPDLIWWKPKLWKISVGWWFSMINYEWPYTKNLRKGWLKCIIYKLSAELLFVYFIYLSNSLVESLIHATWELPSLIQQNHNPLYAVRCKEYKQWTAKAWWI